jgi:hypothetical protein
MNLKKYINLSLVVLFLSSSLNTFADNSLSDSASAEFFVSNNTDEINLHTAFNRLRGKEQQKLQNKLINLLQKQHIEQSKFEELLGTYTMSNQRITADNSEKIITSPYQKLPPETIFNIAKKLASLLNQESVAVFIPDEEQPIGDVVLELKSHNYTVNEIIQLIQKTLPAYYNHAFSLHLNSNACSNFDNTIVDKVEWLGSTIKPEEISRTFPEEQMIYHHGRAYLIYKNGRNKSL